MTLSEPAGYHQDLGQLQSEHLRNRGRNLFFIALIFLGGIVALIGGLFMLSAEMRGRFCISGVGLLFLLLGAWSLYTAVRDRDLRVRVYDEGLVQRRAGSELVIPWEAVSKVHHAVMRSRGRTTHLCTLELRDGQRIQFSDATLKEVADLCRAVEAGTRGPLLQTVVEDLRQGETVSFGKITATREGLSAGNTTLTWNEIEDIEIADGWVRARQAGRWRNLALISRMQNAHVLVALMERLQAAREEEAGA